jgi:formate hydrogenlyase subunit 3/multisubunit Na+/H+ antiporter MnhD subunit
MIEYLALAPVPALAAAFFASRGEPLVLPKFLYGATLELDAPGAMLLGAASLLWIASGIYAATALRAKAAEARFAVWWLLALIGNAGVFMAADIPSFYLFFAVGSLSAYGLITHDKTAAARRAGAAYVGFALLGEACVLIGLVLTAQAVPSGSLLIRDAVAALPSSPLLPLTLALLMAGFGIKIGLVPVHMWMPLAYAAAPIPAAAVLSGAAVNSGVIGLIRFLPFGAVLPDCGHALAAAGWIAAFTGVAIGVTQSNPKAVLAYSSISQMGVIAAVAGMILAGGSNSSVPALGFYAMHHVLAKGGLFLAIGAMAVTDARHRGPLLLVVAIIALGLGGLPFTGGALAKLAVKSPLGGGVSGVLAALSAVATTLLMLHFVQCLARTSREVAIEGTPSGLVLPWVAIASASLLVPWAVFPSTVPGGLSEVFSLRGLWETLWPVLVGGALAIGLKRWRVILPAIPEGDMIAALPSALRAASVCGSSLERVDALLRQWPSAGVSLLAVALLLGAALGSGN